MNIVSLLSQGNERDFIRDDLRSILAERGVYRHVEWTSDNPPSEEAFLALLSETDILLTGWGSPRLPLALLAAPNRRLRYICNLTGTIQGWIPREYLEAGILVTNWGNGPMWFLAEGALMLMLACSRELPRMRRHMLEQPQWTFPYRAPSPTLRHKTVGFLGFGAIGRILRVMLAPLECEILIYDPYADAIPADCGRTDSLEALFAASDVLTIQCGLSKETRGMVHRGLLDRLKPHAIFINTARGKIVVEKDLIAFLKDRSDVCAGLDVYEVEPLPKDSPLLQLENVICYPHSVGAGGEAMYQALSAFAADNLRAYAEGRALKAVITPSMYDRMT